VPGYTPHSSKSPRTTGFGYRLGTPGTRYPVSAPDFAEVGAGLGPGGRVAGHHVGHDLGAGASGMQTTTTTSDPHAGRGPAVPPQGGPGGRPPRGGADRRVPTPAGHPAASARPGICPRPGRIGPVPVIRVVFLEAAAAFAAVPFLTGHALWIAAGGPLAVLCLLGAVGGGQGRWLGQLALVRADYRERRGFKAPPRPGEAALAPLRETFPALRTSSASNRSGEPVGMIGDGTYLAGVLLVSARAEPLRAARFEQPLPLGAVAAALSDPRVSASCVQIITHTQPAPTPFLPQHAIAVRSYQAVMGDVPAQRTTWIAVRLDPQEALHAVEARGGGAAGMQKTLMTLVQRVAGDVSGAGFEVAPLSEPELIAALATACSVNPMVGTAPNQQSANRRTEETRRAWRCDDRWHTTYWIDRLPALSAQGAPDLFAALTGVPTLATTLAVNATRGSGGSVAFSAYVRLANRSEAGLGEAAKALEQRAAALGIGLTRLDGEQVPGLVATIPLGGAV
jgi:type VII secretion protein EccE